jgi:hypothetical protein
MASILMRAVEKGHISENTAKIYRARIRWIEEYTGRKVKSLLSDAKGTIASIKERSPKSETTQRSITGAFLALFTHSSKLQKAKGREQREFQDFHGGLKVMKTRHHDIVGLKEKIEGLERGSDARLIARMATELPPSIKLVDLIAVKTKDFVDSYTSMYINGKPISIPPNVAREIRRSLKARPRKYLLTSPRTNEPFAKENSLAVYANRVLATSMGQGVTFKTLRSQD